jgi:acetylxylan esterase
MLGKAMLHALRVILLLCCISTSAEITGRAALTQVTSFGANPATLRMYIFVPDALAASPGVVVSLHGASGNAQQQYQSTPYAGLAERYGFVVVYPESPQGSWDATSSQSLLHEGGGASQSIANMAKYVISTYRANANKVFVSGISSGGAMTVSRTTR